MFCIFPIQFFLTIFACYRFNKAGINWAYGIIPIIVAYFFYQTIGASSDFGAMLAYLVDLAAIVTLIIFGARATPIGYEKN